VTGTPHDTREGREERRKAPEMPDHAEGSAELGERGTSRRWRLVEGQRQRHLGG